MIKISHIRYWCSFDAIPDGNVGFVTTGWTNWCSFKASKEHFQTARRWFFERKSRKKSPRNGLFKPFLGLSSLAGAEGLEPSARGFGGDVESPKSTWICRFQAIFVSEKYYWCYFDAIGYSVKEFWREQGKGDALSFQKRRAKKSKFAMPNQRVQITPPRHIRAGSAYNPRCSTFHT